jgi:hypothetical protein
MFRESDTERPYLEPTVQPELFEKLKMTDGSSNREPSTWEVRIPRLRATKQGTVSMNRLYDSRRRRDRVLLHALRVAKLRN